MADAASGKSVELVRAGEPRKLYLFAARFSPDEQWVAFHSRPDPTTRQIFVAPFRNGVVPDRKGWIAVTDGKQMDREPFWSPDGNLLYFISERDGFRCIWAQRLDPATKKPAGPAFVVRDFHTAWRSLSAVSGGVGQIGLSILPDRMIFALGELTGNLWALGRGQ